MTSNQKGFEPKIIGFACNWCGYSAADQAGSAKIQYPPNVRIIRIMCTGMLDPYMILRAFELGFDGVLLVGCHKGDCHYISGNESAEEIIKKTSIIVKALGLDEKRLKMDAASASEGPEFAKIVNEFTEEIRKLGPSPINQTGGNEGV